MGTAIAVKENGSLLGVMNAAMKQMMTIAGRRQRRQVSLGTIPTSCRNTTTRGYMNTTPKIRHMATYKDRYFDGEKRVVMPGPLTDMSQSRALGQTRMAVATPPA